MKILQWDPVKNDWVVRAERIIVFIDDADDATHFYLGTDHAAQDEDWKLEISDDEHRIIELKCMEEA